MRRTRLAELAAAGDRRARQVLGITDSPPRFIAAMQLGVTLTSLAIGALGEHALAKVFDPVLATVLAVILAYLILTFLHVVIGELVPKAVALALLGANRAGRVDAGPHVLRRHAAVDLGPAALDRVAAAGFGLQAPGAEGDRALRGRAEDARERVDRARRDRGGRAGDALQGLRLRRQGGLAT